MAEYTREAGVRQLEREIGKVLRKVATRWPKALPQTPVTIDLDAVRDALGRARSSSRRPPSGRPCQVSRPDWR